MYAWGLFPGAVRQADEFLPFRPEPAGLPLMNSNEIAACLY
jgi:hypothetical protein